MDAEFVYFFYLHTILIFFPQVKWNSDKNEIFFFFFKAENISHYIELYSNNEICYKTAL